MGAMVAMVVPSVTTVERHLKLVTNTDKATIIIAKLCVHMAGKRTLVTEFMICQDVSNLLSLTTATRSSKELLLVTAFRKKLTQSAFCPILMSNPASLQFSSFPRALKMKTL